MSKRELGSGAEARLHDTKTRDLLDETESGGPGSPELAAALQYCDNLPIDWNAKHVPPSQPLTLDRLLDIAAEQQFRSAVRQLVRSRSYDAIRQLLDEELEGKRP